MAEKKSFLEIVLMPLVVAGLGIMGTFFLTQQQEKNALAKAEADRQVKILEIFSEKITSRNERERILGLRLLEAIEPDLAAKLASAVAEAEPEQSPVQRIAYEVATAAKAEARQEPRIFIHIRGNEAKDRANEISEILRQQGLTVPGIERVGPKVPGNTQLRYFREKELPEAERIHEILAQHQIEAELKYIPGYEDSKLIRQNHFELWLAD